MQLTVNTEKHLTSIAKWINFFNIIGCVGMGIVVLMALYFLIANPIPFGRVMGCVYLIVPAVYAYPIIKLMGFVKNIRIAIKDANETNAEEAFDCMRSALKYVGIFTIVVLSLYALLLIFAAIGFALAM